MEAEVEPWKRTLGQTKSQQQPADPGLVRRKPARAAEAPRSLGRAQTGDRKKFSSASTFKRFYDVEGVKCRGCEMLFSFHQELHF